MSQLEALATFKSPSIQIYNLTVGATALNCQFSSAGGIPGIARVRITNLSATQPVSMTLSDQSVVAVPQIPLNITGTATTPTFTNTTMVGSAGANSFGAGSADGIRIQPGQTLEINVSLATRIWLLGTATTAPVQVAALIQNG